MILLVRDTPTHNSWCVNYSFNRIDLRVTATALITLRLKVDKSHVRHMVCL